MKIGILAGTRPEIIKLSPLIKRLYVREEFEPFFIHSGQHYDEDMSNQFLKELELPEPDYNLEIGSGSHAEQLATAIVKIEKILEKEKPAVFIVHGDTNTALAGALAAVKIQVPVAHVEAGLRSFDRSMPEEVNRTLVDHCSSLLFAQSVTASSHLAAESINLQDIIITGNTIVEASLENLKLAEKKSKIMDRVPKKYALVTIHRPENTESKETLMSILEGISKLKCDCVFPVHPRTKKKLEEFELKLPENVQALEPIGYLDFLVLLKNAAFVLTDSGGIQEEALTLSVPCLTARRNTERPETVVMGTNILVGSNSAKIASEGNEILENDEHAKEMIAEENPYGDGSASERIISVLLDRYGTL